MIKNLPLLFLMLMVAGCTTCIDCVKYGDLIETMDEGPGCEMQPITSEGEVIGHICPCLHMQGVIKKGESK